MDKFHDFYYQYVSKERSDNNADARELSESWADEHIAITNKGSVVAGLPGPETTWRHFIDINIIPLLKEYINNAIDEKKPPVLIVCKDANEDASEYITNIMQMKYNKKLQIEYLDTSTESTKKTRIIERQSKRCFILPKAEDVYRLKYIIEEI